MNPVEDLLLTIVVEGDIFSSLSGIVTPVPRDLWTEDRGQSNALASALMETGIL
jgi:hypothetical protein